MSTSQQVSQYQQLLTNLQLHKELAQPGKRKLVAEITQNKTPRMEETYSDEATGRVFSNDMSNACTHKCCICGKLVTLTGMRAHTKCYHDMPIKDYIEKYGNYRTQLAKVFYHKCGLCQEEILLDGDELHKHCNRHKILMKDYTAQFIKSAVHTNREETTKIEVKQDKLEIIPDSKEKGLCETIQDIENILDSFSRNFN